MNVIVAAQTHNRRAVQQNWQHFCDPTLAFTKPRYHDFLSVWRAKAGERKMPKRSEMTARDLKDFLRDILLCQRVSKNPSRYNWRLIGTNATEVVGHHTGRTFEESIPPQHLERWIATTDMILESQQPWRMIGRVHIGGREYLDAENLYVPLAGDDGEPAFIMGLCQYSPHIADHNNFWNDEMASFPSGLL